ncbi:hypothetical protein [Lactiplantibacillus herbarum]|uniref:hypothetical protein n=1 Tax=Lactiplantibacillus herbarum TaxID=1670446 RepID=UPI000A8D98AF|nr:hypothetical protein [Lactiplantibacillus herbarum]
MENSKKGTEIIKDYRAKTSIAFACLDARIDVANIENLLRSKALYCAVTKDLNFIRFQNNEFENFDLEYDSEHDQPGATFRLKGASLDDCNPFETHYLTEIIAEYAMRDFFFVEGSAFEEQYDYFVFSPIVISTSGKDSWDIQVYPTIKIEDNQILIVEFHYFPNDDEIVVQDFADMILKASTVLSDVKFPMEYISALSLSFDEKTVEKFSFEGGDTFLASLTSIRYRNVLSLAAGFISMLVKYEGYTWFSQIAITVSNKNLSDSEIRLLLYDVESKTTNSRYLTELNDFSQWEHAHLYVSGRVTLSLGDIYELSVPTNIICDEICVLNAKIQSYTDAIEESSSITELLEVKQGLLKLRHSIRNKYGRTLMFHDIMNYIATTLFDIDCAIDDVTQISDVFLEKAKVANNLRNTLFQNILAFVSLLLSTSAVVEFICKPFYQLVYGKSMSPFLQLVNYGCVLLLFSILIGGVWFGLKLFEQKK